MIHRSTGEAGQGVLDVHELDRVFEQVERLGQYGGVDGG
jgi:hypothetical protein